MTASRLAPAGALRALCVSADRLHPAALLALVLVLVGLVYLAAPFVVALLTAIVAAIKAGVTLLGAGFLARLALRLAATYRRGEAAR